MDKTTHLRSAIAALRAQLDALEAALEAEPAGDQWLDLESGAAHSGLAADTLRSWARAGILRACRGERGRIMFRRSWVDAAIESRPYAPRSDSAGDDIDPLDAALASGEPVRGR